MKYYVYSASVLQNTNKIISSCQSDWSKIAPGSYIKFPDDDLFYTISKNNKIFILKEFEVLDSRRIKIKENIGIKISKGDILSINYKEYEMSTILSIVDKGQDYKTDDIITVIGGNSVINSNDNQNYSTSFIITDIDEKGGINQISLKDRGRYYTPPESIVEINNKHGKNCKIELSYNVIPNSFILEKEIQLVNNAGENSVFILKDSLPGGIQKGNFSCEKWEITLKEVYEDETRLNYPYEIYNDFTPNIKLPIPLIGSLSSEIIVKNAFFILDNEIKQLKDKIKKLEDKLSS